MDVADHGRPADLPAGAVDEVSLALTMSHAAASWWSGLALDLRWRLAATGAALAAGTIDVARARLISEATAPLSDELARAVEARVQLPGWTLTQPDPGVFHLTTPAGRTYITRPDTYPT